MNRINDESKIIQEKLNENYPYKSTNRRDYPDYPKKPFGVTISKDIINEFNNFHAKLIIEGNRTSKGDLIERAIHLLIMDYEKKQEQQKDVKCI